MRRRTRKKKSMHILVTAVTRMAKGYCCVAGIDQGTDEYVRPVRPVPDERLPRDLLAPDGPFSLGRVVDLGPVRDVGYAPMVEDRQFTPEIARATDGLDPDAYWRTIAAGVKRRLGDIFANLSQQGQRNAAVAEGAGTASLGLFAPASEPALAIESGQVRMRLTDTEMSLSVPVTDIRFYDEADRPRPDVVERVAERLEAGTECVLGVGLGRAFQARRDTQKRHWLQMNGVHLEDDPLWTVSRR